MMAAHMAGRTQKIRLGTAVVVAPLYTPARLLAEIGMVDILSNGRLDLGIGMGYQQYEFDRFCSPLENVREFTGEMLELIHRGLTQEAFELQGKHIQFPRSSISCRPLQKPTPPIWYAGGDPTHLAWLVRHGHTLFVSGLLGGVSRMRKTREYFEGIAAKEGKPARLAVTRLAFVTKNKADAEHYIDCALYQQRLAVALKTRREKVANNYIVQEQPYDEEPSLDNIRRNLPVGDVDSCIEKMVRIVRELTGADYDTAKTALEKSGWLVKRAVARLGRESGPRRVRRRGALGAVRCRAAAEAGRSRIAAARRRRRAALIRSPASRWRPPRAPDRGRLDAHQAPPPCSLLSSPHPIEIGRAHV